MGQLFNLWEKLYDLKFYATELNLKTFLFALCVFPARLARDCFFVLFCFPGGGLLFFPVLLAFLLSWSVPEPSQVIRSSSSSDLY